MLWENPGEWEKLEESGGKRDPHICRGRRGPTFWEGYCPGRFQHISFIVEGNGQAGEIIDHYPSLAIDDIRGAAAYAAEITRENVWKISA